MSLLYLIRPDAIIEWIDLPTDSVKKAAKRGRDIAGIDWQRAYGISYSKDLVRVALRHGIPCSAGLAVDAGIVHDLVHANEVTGMSTQNAIAELRRSTAHRPWDEWADRQAPGSKARDAQRDRDIAAARQRAAGNFVSETDRLLVAPIKPELVRLWEELTGAPWHD